MRYQLSLLLIFAGALATSAFAAKPPPMPSPDTVAQWAGFDRKVPFEREEIKRGDWAKWGRPVWIAAYQAPKGSLTSFVISLYERGSFIFNSHLDDLRKDAEKFAYKPAKDQPIRIDKLPDGRELFTFVAGVGPGGSLLLSFARSKDARYDIVLGMIGNSEHGVPPGERLQHPAEPKTSVSDMFLKFDAYLNAHLSSRRAATAPTLGDHSE